jgi:phosphomannomutase/phosphoglucomutase
MFRELGCEVIELYCEMDGRFPNHHPDPTVVENLQDLITEVKKQCADLGVAFDGDGDRIGAVDDQGRIIWGDYLMILYSREVLRRNPGAAIIGEVKCSMNLYNDIESHGGRGIMWKAGHSFIKAKMKEEDAALAGEMSGHMFFADRYFGYDDATYAGCRLLELLSETGQTISELLADVPEVFSTPELRMDIPEKFKFEIVRRAQETFGKKFQTVTVDGVRIVLEDGWALVRASNTQPALVLRFEAETKARLDEIQDGVTRELTAIARSVMSETECLD